MLWRSLVNCSCANNCLFETHGAKVCPLKQKFSATAATLNSALPPQTAESFAGFLLAWATNHGGLLTWAQYRLRPCYPILFHSHSLQKAKAHFPLLLSAMDDASPLFDERPTPNQVSHQALRQHLFSLLLAVFTVGLLLATILFAFNYSLLRPISPNLLFKNPVNSVLLLNVLSQVSMFCVAELAFCLLDVLRWALASRSSGTSAYTFLALSRATNLFGVLYLIFRKGPDTGRFHLDGHRLWGLQRYFIPFGKENLKERITFVVLRVALSVLLLSDFSIEPSFPEVYQSHVLEAGLSPINTSLTISYDFNDLALSPFWLYFNTILSDARNVRAVDPLNCAPRDACQAFFLPGTPAKLVTDPSQPVLTTENYTTAVSVVQHDAPGYQLDFLPIEGDIPPMLLTDCHLYGTTQNAIQICLKRVEASFVASGPSKGGVH